MDKLLGHPRKKAISSVLCTLKDFDSSSCEFKYLCNIFIQSEHSRDSFYGSSNKSTNFFSLIHFDLWGPYKTKSSFGAHCFLSIVVDHSRAVWTHLLLAKSEVAQVLKNFCAMLERQFGKKVQMAWSGNGTEFMCLCYHFLEIESPIIPHVLEFHSKTNVLWA